MRDSGHYVGYRILRTIRRTFNRFFFSKINRARHKQVRLVDQVVFYAAFPLKCRFFLLSELYAVTRYFSKTAASYSPVRHMYEKHNQFIDIAPNRPMP